MRVCAYEAGVSLELSNVDFSKGENRTSEYLSLNPMGKAPTLVDGDFALWESAAELCYVAQVGRSPLWPSDARGQADVLRWLFFCSCHVDPYFTTLVVERFIKARRGAPEDEAATAGAIQWLARFVQVVEQRLSDREHVVGRFGLADIALGCTLELSPLVRYDLSAYPPGLARAASRPRVVARLHRGVIGMPRARAHADVFHAIADPTRRAILDRLRAGPAPVNALASDFEQSRPAVSKHLRVLRLARLVVEERFGRERLYQLRPHGLQSVAGWLEGYRSFWQVNLDSLKQHLEGKER